MVAEVAVAEATMYYDKLYTYIVPEQMRPRVFSGSIVLVPFGWGNRQPRLGVVLETRQVPAAEKSWKELLDTAPEEAVLTPELLAIVTYLKQATFCTWFEAVKAVIPYGAQYRGVNTAEGWRLEKKISRHTEVFYSITPQGRQALQEGFFTPAGAEKPKKVNEKQQKVLAFIQQQSRTRTQVEEACEVGKAVPETLVKHGLLTAGQQDKEIEIAGLEKQPEMAEGLAQGFGLSAAQQQVAARLTQKMGEENPVPALLYGVTGSGKTQVFLEVVRQALLAGKTALVLVPEIGLTPQMMAQLHKAFGEKVAVQHSRLSNTERLLQWRQIQRGETPVVVGTRSAVFAPLENIGVIVVDEEQERSYQSESAPRYDAVEVAKRRAARHGALLLLASATPAISDYYLAQSGRYELLTLTQRYGNLPLPAVEIVDMRNEPLGGNIISERLAVEIARNVEEKAQTILLLNRRGYHRIGVCKDCREVIKCSDCSVPMVYHKDKSGGYLLCHYCGKSHQPAPMVCPACGGEIRYAGFGTQRMEEELATRFPTARILRMDLDTTGQKDAHRKMLKQFENGEFDIMVGTQMVAKGLDFERVNLVGVVGIDSLLFSQGYRAFENVFSLVTQVVGRSGRANKPGRALIQTLDPENQVLRLAASQNYDAFYQQEIAFRKMALYPPFCSLCMVGFIAQEEQDALHAAKRFNALLSQKAREADGLPLRVLGPAPMNIVQIAGSYRYRLTLKCRNDNQFREMLTKVLEQYNKEGLPRKASVYIDFHSDAAS